MGAGAAAANVAGARLFYNRPFMLALASVLAAVRALGAAPALAAPVYEAGREPPIPYEERKERSDSVQFALDEYLANRGDAAARPDGSGSAQSRLRLSLVDMASDEQARALGDVMMLTDRRASGVRAASLEYYLGLERASEEGHFLRIGRDEALPLDRGGKSTRDWELRLGRALRGKLWTLGMFVAWDFKNDGRPARPDYSGESYLDYAAFGRMEMAGPLWLEGEADFLTDVHRRRYAPASLEGSVSLGVTLGLVEAKLGWRPWRMLDRGGAVDSWLASLSVRFDSQRPSQLREERRLSEWPAGSQ